MSLFRLIKYSSILFFLGKYKFKLFRVIAVLLFAGVTSLLYGDIEAYLAREHPGTVIYALTAKICIVYGALAFVLWQFKPDAADTSTASPSVDRRVPKEGGGAADGSADRLSEFANLDRHDHLRSRSEALLKKR